MKEYQSLSHTRWGCRYHVVFIPRRRRKKTFDARRKGQVEIFHDLASHEESRTVEGHLMRDHIRIWVGTSPKYAVSNMVVYLKGRSAITIARQFGDQMRNFSREEFGCEATAYRRWGWTRRWCERTREIMKNRVRDTTG
jgi:putative transposase